ncbi:MAG: DNA gyrase subunit A [Gammaproteobacteria bacterium]
MVELAKSIAPVKIEDELKQSYLDYAMSVIVGRALPDVRDGLKPVHRRVLFAMHELSNDWNKPYKKSARVVGDVIGKYHPHGDTAVYDTIVRMAQPFSLRYLLVDGQGNFGSVDGDPPAAMRYTEIRMSRFAHALLADLEKETVDFVPNYDESEQMPTVMPTRVPNLLVNGSSGIAVGMATNIPPHNLNEVIDACIALIEKPTISLEELMQYIPGPDFPTAAIISGAGGIVEAYRTGRGKIYVRSKISVEGEEGGKQAIIINELPYQVNKARLIEKIAELVKEKKIEGITALRDESDKDGMRVVIEVRRGDNIDVLQNNLFSQTQMEVVFGINMVALVEGRPQTLSLKQLLEAFLRHRREVVTRRTLFELRKSRQRAHILEGLAIALANIDPIIALIKQASTPQAAKEALLAQIWMPGSVTAMLERAEAQQKLAADQNGEFGLINNQGNLLYRLSPTQAQAILDLRLHRLTGLEQDKILQEYNELLDTITDLLDILGNQERLLNVIREELLADKQQFGDVRRTEIIGAREGFMVEDLIEDEQVVVTLSREGYVKYQPSSEYRAQRRGGKGKSAANVKDEDVIAELIIANTHDTVLCFSTRGKLYWLKVYELPLASRLSRGKPMVNLLPLEQDERITTILPIRDFVGEHYVFMATEQGTVKKTSLSEFSRPRANGIRALELLEDDNLVGVVIVAPDQDIMLFTNAGKAIRFHEKHVRPMGRTARGVRGVRMGEGQKVIALMVAHKEGQVLTATANGYGKRTCVTQYPVKGRGGQGVIAIQVNERNGEVVGAVQVTHNDELMLITDRGTVVRTRVNEISLVGRNAQGVRLISLAEDEKLVGIQRIAEADADEDILPLEGNCDSVDTEDAADTEDATDAADASADEE